MKIKKWTAVMVSIMIMILSVSVPKVLGEENSNADVTKIWDGTYDITWFDEQDTEFHITNAEQLAGLRYLGRCSSVKNPSKLNRPIHINQQV